MLSRYAKQSIVNLTTVGRKSGKKFTVKIWFVVADEHAVYVQHVTAPANWCKNLAKNPEVELDFGAGPLAGRATVIADPPRAQQVLGLFRNKYFFARFLQFFGRRHTPFVARIECAA